MATKSPAGGLFWAAAGMGVGLAVTHQVAERPASAGAASLYVPALVGGGIGLHTAPRWASAGGAVMRAPAAALGAVLGAAAAVTAAHAITAGGK